MIAQRLRTNPAPISAIALVVGFALIVSGSSPWGTVAGALLTLLAFLAPFIRLSFVAGSPLDTTKQKSVRPEDSSPVVPAETQSAEFAEPLLRQRSGEERQGTGAESWIPAAVRAPDRTREEALFIAIDSIGHVETLLQQDLREGSEDSRERVQHLTDLVSFSRTAVALEIDPDAIVLLLGGLKDLEIEDLARRSRAMLSLLAESNDTAEMRHRRRVG